MPKVSEVIDVAKKKRRKKKNQLSKQVKHELLGLLFIFLAIFGSGASAISDGAIPGGLEHIFRFFLGIWYFIASLFLLVTGIVLMVKRRYPDFSNKKMIGFYIIFGGVLLLTHIQTYERLLVSSEEASILKATWENFFAFVDGSGAALQTGGGILGAILFAFCYFLFSSGGAKILAVFSILIGIIFMTEFSLGEFFSKWGKRLISMMKSIKERMAASKNDSKSDEEVIYENHPETDHESAQNDEPVIQDFTDVAYSFDTHESSQNDMDAVMDKDDTSETAIKAGEDNPQPMTEAENHAYELPPPNLLAEPTQSSQQQEKSQIQATVRKLERTFNSFGVKARVTKVHVGPAVTKYEVYPEAGVKVSKIVNLHDDLALALAAKDIRIEAPIPGKSAVGIEVPNQEIAQVSLREVLDNSFTKQSSKLLFALGRDISGDSIVSELSKMPHMLIAGATGSGKSVCVNGIITTILMRAKPHEVKM